MLHFETIAPETLALLRRIQSHPAFAETRLVGGTALALQLGHRVSVDLDIFGKWNYSDGLDAALATVGRVVRESGSQNGKMAFYYVDDVKVDCVSYEMYGWLDPAIEEEGVRIAAVRDIAAMKINAVTNRGTRKDFVDVARLLEDHPLHEIFGWYRMKYPAANPALAMRSLSYFVDAETMPMPRMLIPFDWEEAKDRIRAAVRKFATGEEIIPKG
ncbi:MAG: nucleotidyl transferase AbiEii/AbiGii toxin family protein [Kiritimatiellae bacterium]|nr:nucleotidyl transferase AbiEii/AbiGii toxin family protein [Kiritimatiellia bacterium]